MSVQITALFRQGVVRPLNAKARDELLTFFISDAIRCEWLPIIDEAYFATIWQTGLLQAIGAACNEHFSDYEEIVIPAEKIVDARNAVVPFLTTGKGGIQTFAAALHELLSDAGRDQMPVLFIL